MKLHLGLSDTSFHRHIAAVMLRHMNKVIRAMFSDLLFREFSSHLQLSNEVQLSRIR